MTKINSTKVAAILLAALLLLVVNREFGVADNGDFTRYMSGLATKPAELEENWPTSSSDDWTRRFFSQPIFYWTSDVDDGRDGWFTSASIFWRFGGWLNEGLYSNNVLAIRYLGLPFFALQFLGLAFVLIKLNLKSLAATAVFFPVFLIMTDARITAFYNTMYAESVPILAVLFLFSFLVARTYSSDEHVQSRAVEVLCSGMVLLLLIAAIFAKRQYAYFFIPALLFGFHIVRKQLRLGKRSALLVLACSAMILGLAFVAVTKSERLENPGEVNSSRITTYHALYFGLLSHASDPSKLLDELNLPPESKHLIGKSAWNSDSREFISTEPNINLRTFLSAVAADPSAFLRSWLSNAGEVGNFDIPLGMIYGARNEYPPIWLTLPSVISSAASGIVLLSVTVFLALLVVARPLGETPDGKYACRILTVTLLAVVFLDITVSTFDGQQEARKHVIVASVALVLLMVLVFASLASPAVTWLNSVARRFLGSRGGVASQ